MGPIDWIDSLAKGGPWAITVALAFAVIYLWRSYVKVRDAHEKKTEAIHKEIINLVTRAIENETKIEAAITVNTTAIQNFDRRLESVEKAVQG